MTALPSSLSLTTIADGSNIIASDHRTNYASAQTAVNALISCLSGGTVGQVLQAIDASHVQWQTLLQLVDTAQKYKIQFGSTTGTTNGSGVLAVTYGSAFAAATDTVVVMNGDTAAIGTALVGVSGSPTTTGFNADFGGTHPTVAARANWVAIGH